MVLTAIFTLGIGVAIHALWTSFLRRQLDNRLREVAGEVAAVIGANRDQISLPKVSTLPVFVGGPILVVVRDERGNVLQSEPPGAPSPPFTAAGGRTEVRDLRSPALEPYLGAGTVRMVTHPGPWETTIQVAVSRGPLAAREWSLWLVFVGAVPPLTAGAVVGAWLIARRRLRRLRHIADLAAEIGPRQLNRRLDTSGPEDELGRMASEVNRMLGRLEAGFAAQDRFISEVAHELKTPVSVMLLEAQILARSDADANAHQRFVVSVEEEMRRLTKLIESFLTLARAEHGEAQVRHVDVDLNDTVMEAGEHCWAYAQQRDIRLSASLLPEDHSAEPPIVAGDPELLRTMVENLLRNAISVSPRRSAIDLRVTREDHAVTVRVRDRGPGVPDALSSRIFERFVSSDYTQSGTQGTGLGLAIARGIAEVHGGAITFRNLGSEDGGGAEFSVRLPLARGAPHPAPAA